MWKKVRQAGWMRHPERNSTQGGVQASAREEFGSRAPAWSWWRTGLELSASHNDPTR